MPIEITREKMNELRDHFVSRQHELLALTCALVEAESPSGDKDGSIAAVSLLASAAATIGSVSSVERISSEEFGEHLRIKAFTDNNSPPIVILGHTDTVHPRGAIKERPWRAEGNRIYGPGIFDMKANCALVLDVMIACEVSESVPGSTFQRLMICQEVPVGSMGR